MHTRNVQMIQKAKPGNDNIFTAAMNRTYTVC